MSRRGGVNAVDNSGDGNGDNAANVYKSVSKKVVGDDGECVGDAALSSSMFVKTEKRASDK